MLMIVMEGHVAEEQWPTLLAAYEAGSKNMPAPMLQMFLAQDVSDRTLWRAVTIWQSVEALQEYRKTAPTHGGEAIFRAAGAQPTHSASNVAVHGSTAAA